MLGAADKQYAGSQTREAKGRSEGGGSWETGRRGDECDVLALSTAACAQTIAHPAPTPRPIIVYSKRTSYEPLRLHWFWIKWKAEWQRTFPAQGARLENNLLTSSNAYLIST